MQFDFSNYTKNQMKHFEQDGVPIVCKDIQYDLKDNPNYETAIQYAIETVEKIYNDNREEENLEIEEMLQNGEISDRSEYDALYQEDFDKNRYTKVIDDYTQKYMKNYLDLSDKVVIFVPMDKINDFTNDDLKKALSEKTGINIIKEGYFDIAKPTDIINQKSYDTIGKTIEGKDFRKFLDLKSNLTNYSCTNISLVYAQYPNARATKGFQSWKKEERYVRQGEKGISILAPNKAILKTEDAVNKYATKHNYTDNQRKLMIEKFQKNGEVSVLSYFSAINVFDIAQTEPMSEKGKDIEKLLNLEKPLKKDMQNFKMVATALENVNLYDNACTIDFNGEQSEQDKLYESIYRVAEETFSKNPELITGIKNNIVSSINEQTMETAIATYLVCKHIGINCEDTLNLKIADSINDTGKYRFLHGKREMFENSFKRGSLFADEFIKSFDLNLEKLQEQSKEKTKKQKDVER